MNDRKAGAIPESVIFAPAVFPIHLSIGERAGSIWCVVRCSENLSLGFKILVQFLILVILFQKVAVAV